MKENLLAEHQSQLELVLHKEEGSSASDELQLVVPDCTDIRLRPRYSECPHSHDDVLLILLRSEFKFRSLC